MNRQGTQTKWILILTSLGFFMSMMDSMIVTTASTAIRLDFRITVGTLQWALNAYNVTIAAVLLVGVALGERYGRRRVYSYGLVIFTLGSILCALATNITWLIIARVVEGVGASVMTPLSMAILSHALPVSERGRALGIWSGIGGLALIVGPSLGGLIVARLSWQWIFWINVPVGVVALGLTGRLLPESYGRRERLSGLDASLIMVASAGLIWALSALTSAQVDRVVVMSVTGSLVYLAAETSIAATNAIGFFPLGSLSWRQLGNIFTICVDVRGGFLLTAVFPDRWASQCVDGGIGIITVDRNLGRGGAICWLGCGPIW